MSHAPCATMAFKFFTVYKKLAEIAVLASKDLTSAKISYLQWGFDLMLEIITGSMLNQLS